MKPISALKLLKEETDLGRFNRRIFEDFAYSLTDFSSVSNHKTYRSILGT